MAGYTPFDPNKPLQAPAPADTAPAAAAPAPAPTKPGGYVPFNPNAAPTGGQQQTTGGGQPQQSQPGWGIDWNNPWYKGGPALKAPQSVQDFGDIAGNEAMAQNPANYADARKRLGPVASAGADVVGNVLSPTSLLMALPGGAPVAGALHEGLKSYAAGNPWSTIADDAAAGSLFGFGGQLAAKAAPVVLPQLTKAAIDLGPAAAMTGVAHKLFGEPYKDVLTALGGYALTRNMSEGAGEAAKKVSEWAPTQQAIKSLILGGSSAFRQGAGPWDQWIPGQ
jgi:hypothetical protein